MPASVNFTQARTPPPRSEDSRGSPRDTTKSCTSVHKSNVISFLQIQINQPCGSLRPLSEPSTTTPQKNTRLVTCVSDELLFVGFHSSPVASGTTLRGEWMSAMYYDRLFRAVAGWISSRGRRVARRREGVEEIGCRCSTTLFVFASTRRHVTFLFLFVAESMF
jgi:hypothetical protein